MSATDAHFYESGPHCPLQLDEIYVVQQVLDQLKAQAEHREIASAILEQARSLDAFGELLARYPSPLAEQRLGKKRRGLETLVTALCTSDRTGFLLRAPTQAIVGRALNMAQINFFRLMWHGCGLLHNQELAMSLRERTARFLRTSVYTQLVEEVFSELATDNALEHTVRARAVRQLALLWGHRLTWRVSAFFPVLESTWEARSRVRVVGGTLLGTSEIVQLITEGADERFVDLLTQREHAEEELLAFREFLFGRSSEELDRIVERMAADNLTSVQLDSQISQLSGNRERDTGSLFYEFFQERFLQSSARRVANLHGPKHTAEGYVLLAWLQHMPEAEG